MPQTRTYPELFYISYPLFCPPRNPVVSKFRKGSEILMAAHSGTWCRSSLSPESCRWEPLLPALSSPTPHFITCWKQREKRTGTEPGLYCLKFHPRDMLLLAGLPFSCVHNLEDRGQGDVSHSPTSSRACAVLRMLLPSLFPTLSFFHSEQT